MWWWSRGGSSRSRMSAHDLARAQVGERLVRVAGGTQHLVGMLAQRRWRTDVARRRRREEQGRGGQRQAADVGMLVLARHRVVAREGMAPELVDRVHRPGGNVVRAQGVEPFVARPGAEARLEDR